VFSCRQGNVVVSRNDRDTPWTEKLGAASEVNETSNLTSMTANIDGAHDWYLRTDEAEFQ
jgi:hypothetical protein